MICPPSSRWIRSIPVISAWPGEAMSSASGMSIAPAPGGAADTVEEAFALGAAGAAPSPAGMPPARAGGLVAPAVGGTSAARAPGPLLALGAPAVRPAACRGRVTGARRPSAAGAAPIRRREPERPALLRREKGWPLGPGRCRGRHHRFPRPGRPEPRPGSAGRSGTAFSRGGRRQRPGRSPTAPGSGRSGRTQKRGRAAGPRRTRWS